MPRTLTYSERAISRALSQFLAPGMVRAVLERLRSDHGIGEEHAPAQNVTPEDVERAKARLRRAGVRVDE